MLDRLPASSAFYLAGKWEQPGQAYSPVSHPQHWSIGHSFAEAAGEHPCANIWESLACYQRAGDLRPCSGRQEGYRSHWATDTGFSNTVYAGAEHTVSNILSSTSL